MKCRNENSLHFIHDRMEEKIIKFHLIFFCIFHSSRRDVQQCVQKKIVEKCPQNKNQIKFKFIFIFILVCLRISRKKTWKNCFLSIIRLFIFHNFSCVIIRQRERSVIQWKKIYIVVVDIVGLVWISGMSMNVGEKIIIWQQIEVNPLIYICPNVVAFFFTR